jgi:MoxR-like ATPase
MANSAGIDSSRRDVRTIRTPGGLLLDERAWRLLLRNVEREKHTLIVGPTGVGKTRLAIEVGAECGRSVEVFHFGGVFDAEATITGTTRLRAGETRFVRSRFVDAITRPGCVIVADEINRASGATLNALLSLLDWNERIALDLEDGDQRIVQSAPGVVVLATANVGAEYVHTEALDAALLNRMHIVRLDFPEEEQMLVEELGVPGRTAAWLVRIAREVRKAQTQGQLAATVSTRGLLEAAELVRDGFPVESAFEAIVATLDGPGLAALRALVRATR